MRWTWHHIWPRRVVATLALVGTIGMSAEVPVPAALAQGGGVWGERAPMLLPRSEASVAELNGKIYFIGGYPGTRVTSDSVQIYDPGTDSWELGPPLRAVGIGAFGSQAPSCSSSTSRPRWKMDSLPVGLPASPPMT